MTDKLMTDKEKCNWTDRGNGVWFTLCGEAFSFDDGANEFTYCPYCGKKIVQGERVVVKNSGLQRNMRHG